LAGFGHRIFVLIREQVDRRVRHPDGWFRGSPARRYWDDTTTKEHAHMSHDEKAAKELVETLKDGERGFADSAAKLRDSEHPAWGETLERLSTQRAGFRAEIVELGHEYGDDVDESGSVAAAVHRGWISLKDALTGDDAGSVLDAVVTGEDHAVSEYDKALELELSSGFRDVVTRQRAAVVAARDEVRSLRAAG
jgi:uncharacterized protein (TIGR02284 family)